MNRKLTVIIFIISVLVSCNHSEKLDETIIGTWTMYQVFESGSDMTAKHNPAGDRWISFKPDGTFISGGEPFGSNKGNWKADNKQSVLYLDSDVDDDDSDWKVSFKSNQTIWTGIGHPRKENTKLIHVRKEK